MLPGKMMTGLQFPIHEWSPDLRMSVTSHLFKKSATRKGPWA